MKQIQILLEIALIWVILISIYLFRADLPVIVYGSLGVMLSASYISVRKIGLGRVVKIIDKDDLLGTLVCGAGTFGLFVTVIVVITSIVQNFPPTHIAPMLTASLWSVLIMILNLRANYMDSYLNKTRENRLEQKKKQFLGIWTEQYEKDFI